MKTKICLFLTVLLPGLSLFAQNKLPVIRASSDKVDIRDGDYLDKGNWTISPDLKPDIYYTSSKNQKVTFYTDLEEISVKVKPDTKFDFIILLHDSIEALTEIRYKPSYMETLKNAAKYNPQDQREIPAFTYQESDNPNLVALRKGFNLDSIAGTGNEVSQILNLLHWIHDLVPHDGQHGNPEVKNAMSMIAVCKKENRGLNCRGLATVLNECYLSMGFKSRFVTCLPQDTTDMDCHVINMVYSNDLKKWLWIDPTNDAYVMNERGELLSIEEVRQRLIDGKPLIVNPDANWNHKSSTVKENYLDYYMAKNLYRLECPVRSEYDTETQAKGKTIHYVSLLSMDAANQKPDTTQWTRKESGTNYITYKTNNPAVFWQLPSKTENN